MLREPARAAGLVMLRGELGGLGAGGRAVGTRRPVRRPHEAASLPQPGSWRGWDSPTEPVRL